MDWQKEPVFFPGLPRDRHRVKAVAIAIPESCASREAIDVNRHAYRPARRFDLEGGLSIGDGQARVLVCHSHLPEARSGGEKIILRWPQLPVPRDQLFKCWLLILGHESINLRVNDIPRRITRAKTREGKNFAWYAFRLYHLMPDPATSSTEAAVKAINVYPPLPSWRIKLTARMTDQSRTCSVTVATEARTSDKLRRAA